MNYFAAHEIDKFVYETFFLNKTDGYFVDIGAHDGVSINNTLFFENLGWTGICFEPIPSVYEKLKNNRKCKCVQKAIDNTPGIKQFFVIDGYSEMLSGIADKYQEEHIVRINREIMQIRQTYSYIDVECSTFENEVENNVIDLLSIDTEGNELDILSTINFTKYKINVMVIEYNYHNQAMLHLFRDNGFEIVKQIGVDLILKNKTICI